MEVAPDEVTDVVRQNLKLYEDMRNEWRWFRAAFKTEFWTANKWQDSQLAGGDEEADDGLPFKLEVNQVWPFIEAVVANLFYRGPRTQVELPAVFETPTGRPPDYTEAPDVIGAYLDEWLKRGALRKRSTRCYAMALLYGSAGFKVGIDTTRKRGDIISRSWVQAVPPWEMILDREATEEDQQAFIGHLRWERFDRAKAIVGDELTGATRSALPDYIADGGQQVKREGKLEQYVRILEFYDLLAGKQRFYLVEGSTTAPSVKQVGEEGAIPYELPDGTPGIPLIPVVLTAVPETPMDGIPAAKRVYGLNAEKNMLLTILGNKMRREAATAHMHRENALDDHALALWASGRDGVMLKVKAGEGSLQNAIAPVPVNPVAPSLDKLMLWLSDAWQDTQGASDMMQGKQGKYISATESSLLASFGEATSSNLQQQMADAMCQTMKVFLVMTKEHLGSKRMSVRVGAKPVVLDPDLLALPWEVSIIDSASTPVKDMRKKEAFLQVQKLIVELVGIAAGGPKDPQTGESSVQPAAVLMAQRMLDYMQQLWQLPEDLSWSSLAAATAEEDKDPKKEAERIFRERIAPDLQAAMAGGNAPAPGAAPPGTMPPGVV